MPSRSSQASCSPVDAPLGTAARPRAPPASSTSASTVGLPRESMIWRAVMAVMRVSDIALGSLVMTPRTLSRGPWQADFLFANVVRLARAREGDAPFRAEVRRSVKGTIRYDCGTSASRLSRQFHAVTQRFAEQSLPDDRLVGNDPELGRAIPRSEDAVSLFIALRVAQGYDRPDRDLVMSGFSKFVPRARERSRAASARRRIKTRCCSLADLNSKFSRRSP